MDFDTIRPILSGLAGAAIAAWVGTKWARWIPSQCGRKGRQTLIDENRGTIKVANILTGSALGGIVLCYQSGWLARNDWRGLGVAFGLMVFLPFCYIVAVRARQGTEAIKECFVTYAICQKMPPLLLFPLMGLLFVAGIISAVAFFI